MDCLHQLESTRLYLERPILWNHHGINICSQAPIPDDQEVTVGVNIYNASKPEFSFPEGFSVSDKNYVYQIKVAARNQSLQLISGIQIILTNLPHLDGTKCLSILEAQANPTKSETGQPLFRFYHVKAPRFQHQSRSVKIAMRSNTCYLVIASKCIALAIILTDVIIS